MFDLDKLKEKASALSSFGKKEKEEEEKNDKEKIKEFQVLKRESDLELDEGKKEVQTVDDIGETKGIEQIIAEESARKEKESEEKSLDDKLADIEKVISTFTEETPLSTLKSPFSKSPTFDLNKPIDFSKSIAKSYVEPFIAQPSSQKDRVALLYESLKKQKLI